MSIEGSVGGALEPAPDHIRVVESVLDVPLLPEGGEDTTLADGSFQRFVFDSVVQAVRERWPGAIQSDGIDLDASRAEELGAALETRTLAMQLQAANDTLSVWRHPPAMPADTDQADSPRAAFQSRAMGGIVEHSQRAPKQSVASDSRSYRHGLLTVAPPGAGKSALQGLMLNCAGIGLPASERDLRRRTAVGIANSLHLINQLIDPDQTLQRFASVGDRVVRMGAYYGDRHDGHDEYDVIWTTPRSYEKAVESGAINTQTTVRYSLDEAHRTALAPGMQPHLARLSSGLYMFTATPAIAYGRRDLRRHYPHSQIGTTLEFIEDGILSPVQLFTYRAGPESGSAEAIALRLAGDYVASGRKTLIVCQPGGMIQQARQVAHRLNELFERGDIRPHDKFNFDGDKLACAFGRHSELESKADLERLRRGERLIAATVATGKEGLDIPDLDALILIGPHGAQWEVDQWLGRVLRRSGQMAIASEILPHALTPRKTLASIFAMLGSEGMVVSGQYIGQRREAVDERITDTDRPERLSSPLPLPGTDAALADDNQTAALPSSEPAQPNTASGPPEGQEYIPPSELSEFVVSGVSLREVTIAPAGLARVRPPDYHSLIDLAPPDVPVEWLYNILDKVDMAAFLQELSVEERSAIQDQTIRYVLDWEDAEKSRLLRYYSPLARLYFEKHPVPVLVGEAEFLDVQMATMLGVSRNFVRGTIEKLGIQPLDRISKYHRSPHYFDMAAFKRIAIEIDKVPIAELTDVAMYDLVHETGETFVKDYIERHGIATSLKRRNPFWGVSDVVNHLSEAEANIIRGAYERRGVANPEKVINLPEMAQLAGTSVSYVLTKLKALTDERRPEIGWLRTKAGGPPAEYVDRRWGMAFIEYVKPEKVLPWEVTAGMVAAYFGRSPQAMEGVIARRPWLPSSKNIALPGVKAMAVYPLHILVGLQQPHGKFKAIIPAPNVPPVDVTRAALSSTHARNSAKVAYSQRLQSYFIAPEQIAPPDQVSYYSRRRVTPPPLPAPVPLPQDAMLSNRKRRALLTRSTVADIQRYLASLSVDVEAQFIVDAASEPDSMRMVVPMAPDDEYPEVTYSHYGARLIVKAVLEDLGLDYRAVISQESN